MMRENWIQQIPEQISDTREQLILNSIWNFMPAKGIAGDAPAGDWGSLYVPGAWYRPGYPDFRLEGIQQKGDSWGQMEPIQINRGWYERSFMAPQHWSEKKIILQVDKIGGLARCWINGTELGQVNAQGDEFDISEQILAGQENTIRFLVAGDTDPRRAALLIEKDYPDMDANVGGMETCGLNGNITLLALPRTSRIDGISIRPSFRKKMLEVDFTFENLTADGTLLCEVQDADGRTVLTGTYTVSGSSFTAEMPWEDPVLWEYKSPYLYRLTATLDADGRDQLSDTFGFREFWIEGRDFYLNGHIFRARPTLAAEAVTAGNHKAIRNHIQGYIDAGFNLIEFWPNDEKQMGSAIMRPEWAEEADALGLPLMYPLDSVSSFFNRPGNEDEKFAQWEEAFAKTWKKVRNHPSIFLFVCTGNRYGHGDDQNPRRIGNSKTLMASSAANSVGTDGTTLNTSDSWMRMFEEGKRVVETIRKYETTRPIVSHHCSNIGDVHTLNHYMDLTPLQEREEWLSDWSREGDKPFMAVEFGVPFMNTFARGRNGYGNSVHTEPLMTEFSAIYLGEAAYRMEDTSITAFMQQEPGWYRKRIAESFQHDQVYSNNEFYQFAPAFQEIVALFIRNTWRSFRTFGVSGGMIPWSEGYIRETNQAGLLTFPYEQEGQKGNYIASMRLKDFYGYHAKSGLHWTLAGREFLKVNGDTLAWIGGKTGQFWEKNHHFYGGETLEKSIVCINDYKDTVIADGFWSLESDGDVICRQSIHQSVEPGQILFLPVSIPLPSVKGKKQYTLRLSAHMGQITHTDSFAITLYPAASQQTGSVTVLDHTGEMQAKLRSLGYCTKDWDQTSLPTEKILVIGQDMLKEVRDSQLLKEYVQAGGQLLLLAQNPDWIRNTLHFRVSRHVTRYVFPVSTQKDHPILQGITQEDLYNWNGSGTLLPEKAFVDLTNVKLPTYGYHWGNTASVASASIEKPHNSTWTPILECEFDLSYSPLMETRSGDGRIVFCGMDLEARTEADPAAELLLCNMINYLQTPVCTADRKTVFFGQDDSLLKELGVLFTRTQTNALPEEPALVILGEGHGISAEQQKAFMTSGGNILFLGSQAAADWGKMTLTEKLGGETILPDWEELRGVSVADCHLRAFLKKDILDSDAFVWSENRMLGRISGYEGTAILVQVLPQDLNLEKNTYYRYTSWRLHRLLSQCLGNLGGSFITDREIYTIENPELLNLDGDWSYKVVNRLIPSDTPYPDTENVGLQRNYHLQDSEKDEFITISSISFTENEFDGAYWYRREILLPEAWKGKELTLELGAIDDYDTTYCNGVIVGQTGEETPHFWESPRKYTIPASLTTEGRCVLAVRVFDRFGEGGLIGRPSEMKLYADNLADAISMTGEWKCKVEYQLTASTPTTPPCVDTGNRGEKLGYANCDFDDSDWRVVTCPAAFEDGGSYFDGETWFCRTFDCDHAIKEPVLCLQNHEFNRITVYVDGVEATTVEQMGVNRNSRMFALEPLTEGSHYIAIRVFNQMGETMLTEMGSNIEICNRASLLMREIGYYTVGFRNDFELGDDPYRNFRW